MKRRTPEEDREKQRLYREHCKAHGLCQRCRNPLDCDSVQFCAVCLVRQREYRREYGGHQPRKPKKP